MAVDVPTLARLRLGSRLRFLRTRAVVTGDLAASAIRASTTKISRMESGHVASRPADVTALARLYDAASEVDELLDLVRQSGQPGYWDSFADSLSVHVRHHLSLEAAAAEIRVYDGQAVPALLQLPAYSRALYDARDEAGIWRAGLPVAALNRRRALINAEGRSQVWALIGAEVLCRAPSRDARTLAKQVEYLASGLPRDVTVQLVPSSASAQLTAPGPFSVLRFDGQDLPDVVLLEQATSTAVLERPAEVERYLEIFQYLAYAAWTPSDSRVALAGGGGPPGLDAERFMTRSRPPGA